MYLKFPSILATGERGKWGKEREEGGGLIPCLTRSGGAPRRSNFVRDRGAGGLFTGGRSVFMAAVVQGLEHGLDAQGRGAGAVLLQGDAAQGQGRRQGDLGSSGAGQAWCTAVGCRGSGQRAA
jgi:hypothetical protein